MHDSGFLVYLNKFKTFSLDEEDWVLDVICPTWFLDFLGKFSSFPPAFCKLSILIDTLMENKNKNTYLISYIIITIN